LVISTPVRSLTMAERETEHAVLDESDRLEAESAERKARLAARREACDSSSSRPTSARGGSKKTPSNSIRYVDLVNRGEDMLSARKPNIPAAVRLLEQAIALNPNKPSGHMNLAIAHQRSDRHLEAYHAFLAAMARYPEGTEKWGTATCMAYDMLCNLAQENGLDDIYCTCAALPPRPEWMASPEQVLQMATRLVKVADDPKPWTMKGEAEEALDLLQEAARSYMKACSLLKAKGAKEDATREYWMTRARDVLGRLREGPTPSKPEVPKPPDPPPNAYPDVD